MSEIFAKEWFLWALGLVLVFPLLAVALGEAIDRLGREQRPLAAVARGLRSLVLPTAVFYVFATKVLGFASDTVTVRVVQTALWITVLYASLTAFNLLLFEHAESSSWRARAPKLFVDILRLLMIFVGGALVLSVVWNRNLGGLLAALGVGSIVLGLALQDTLGSLMSGIALLFERPFSIGDWIKVGGDEGEVIEINWRSVHLRTRDRDLLVVPNSILAKATITNTCAPTRLHAERIRIAFSLDTPPNRVKAMLTDVALSIPDVLPDPAPKVEVMEFGEDRVHYEARLSTTELRAIPKIRSEFTTRAWYAAQRSGLEFPVPVRTLRSAPPLEPREARRLDECLGSVASLAALDASEREALAAGARLLSFATGEAALTQGDPCEALCIVADGRARVTLRTKDGEEREVMGLAPGEFFGEGALLMRQSSPVTVTAVGDLDVVALDTSSLKPVLESNAGLASDLGHLVEERRRVVQRAKQALRALGPPASPAPATPTPRGSRRGSA
jgi:small-conductance mechanosensitive channel